MIFNRKILHSRHQLSHQQIDRLLNENSGSRYLAEKMRQLERVKYFISLADLLISNEVFFVCYKGAMLSYRIYGDASIRKSVDADIYVDSKIIGRAVEVLLGSGYTFSEEFCWPEKKIQQELIIESSNHIAFDSQGKKLHVELHWALNQCIPVSEKRFKELLNENLTEINYAGRKLLVLNKEFELVNLLIHGSKHAWSNFKWLLDIRDYSVSDIDKEKFSGLVREFKAERIVRQTNILLEKYFNYTLPFNYKCRVPSSFISIPIKTIENENREIGKTSNIIENYIYQWLMFPGLISVKKKFITSIFHAGDLNNIDSKYKIVYYLYRPYSFFRRRVVGS